MYVIVGMLLGFVSFRKGMPMTMKSCFYPLIGDKIYSWPGDMIDILSVITTLFGVCTSLGLGVIQVNAGMNYIWESIEKKTENEVRINFNILDGSHFKLKPSLCPITVSNPF